MAPKYPESTAREMGSPTLQLVVATMLSKTPSLDPTPGILRSRREFKRLSDWKLVLTEGP